ncbi:MULTISPECIES: OmpP1/FadL family transporter [unclassified Shewanella]|uniref:OmpP1/FadL family transporter n=1 Tax=unclassified Shewanella TaxID=196818 RepID=UPI001BC19DE9|nr:MULTISPECIES: OmpP1/FadL family transporter [unclassified Shewanella]GIU08400.1 aromatic hydrocarbon degradation protein [Shewanella sp. MBTL60-112-B1]GIU35311.1 aromatic hydrocarbon degradation protein [Shewanella sp. MBTL60-112-B2]
MKIFNKTLIAVSVALVSTQTMAAGFQINAQSATGIGRAFAGDAVIADNASVLSRNPAAMALFDEKQLSMGLTYADVQVEVQDVALGSVHYGSVDDAAEAKVIPNFYYVSPVNDKFAYGVAMFSNFGTGTDTTDLSSNIVGGILPPPIDLLGKTEVTTINFNLSASYRFNDHFSVGAGVDVIYGSGTLTRGGSMPSMEGPVHTDLADVDADGIAFGGIVGAVYEINADHRFGVSYRFSPEFTADGTVNYLGTDFEEINIPLPDIFQVAGFHQLTEKFALHYTAQMTTWGDFHEITVTDPAEAQLKKYAWDDSWLFSVGGTYTLNDSWTLRAGYMFDQGVVGEVSSISIPDSDRQWYTMGATYNLSKHTSLDFGIAFVRGEETHLTEQSVIGLIDATTTSNATYYSIQYNYKF